MGLERVLRRACGLAAGMIVACWAPAARAQTPVNTTLADFFQPGTQPGDLSEDIAAPSGGCAFCHGVFEGNQTKVWKEWQGSMMAQSARDPLFYACLAIANQDVGQSGDLCIRCHAPKAWLEGRSTPTNASAFIDADRDGINCNFCHRLVDPVYQPGVSPAEDVSILAALGAVPAQPHSGNYVVDPLTPPQPYDPTGFGPRRGPFADAFQGYAGAEPLHPFIVSPFHSRSELCATCHDVSNPAFSRMPDGSYALNALQQPHPTQNKYDMFPLERTYSEWANSDFPFGVDMGGLFGGNLTIVSTCQDCHMPDASATACINEEGTPRDDVPSHEFNGGNAWVQSMIVSLWPQDAVFPAYAENLADSMDRAVSMLQRAALLNVGWGGRSINVRITNRTGHKLPSGYGEGRRMWLNVQFFDAGQQLLAERGAYNSVTATLTTSDTKVYESKHGLDAALAAQTGQPAGPSFHFALNNKIYKDNRIPPMGFTNAAFAAVQAEPVGAAYEDGQYWDDTFFPVPLDAASVAVTLYYQTASKEYIEFLRDENVTNAWGDILHAQWQMTGMSPPVMMASATIPLVPNGDGNNDGVVDLSDYYYLYACLTGPDAGPPGNGCGPFDFDSDLDVDLRDMAECARLFGY